MPILSLGRMETLITAAQDAAVAETQQTEADLRVAAGRTFWVTKSVAATAISTTGVDLTGTASAALIVNDVIVATDVVALGGGTNLAISSDDVVGLPTVFSTAVSGLGASKTVDLANASVTKIKKVLAAGKKLTAKATTADMTGTGNVTFAMEFIRVAAAATIEAAA